ncbi:hypothetical protein J6590_060383 [Homalodisca vitripennis]|nr:hypothetical protein J6590_060383 [Homalodisca vitripennis]
MHTKKLVTSLVKEFALTFQFYVFKTLNYWPLSNPVIKQFENGSGISFNGVYSYQEHLPSQVESSMPLVQLQGSTSKGVGSS